MRLHHVSFAVTDAAIAANFLTRWLGMSICAEYRAADDRPLLHLRTAEGHAVVELIERATVWVGDEVHLGVHVDDFDAILGRLRQAGVALVDGPRRVGRERICFIGLPPDGWRIELNDGLEQESRTPGA
jgi:catechol 2,3-dioxygenase-like lactoylglutathione lyase family enzyme